MWETSCEVQPRPLVTRAVYYRRALCVCPVGPSAAAGWLLWTCWLTWRVSSPVGCQARLSMEFVDCWWVGAGPVQLVAWSESSQLWHPPAGGWHHSPGGGSPQIVSESWWMGLCLRVAFCGAGRPGASVSLLLCGITA